MAYRRRTTRRRRYRPRYVRTGLRNHPVNSNLSVIRNPFSLSSVNPKIPDGKSYLSAGQRLQAVKEFTLEAESWFCFYPGINNGLSFSNSDDAGGVTGNAQSLIMPYRNHVQLYNRTSDQNHGFRQVGNHVAQWRIVSQGLRLNLTNNSDENDGWFECIRITLNASEAGMFVQKADVSPNVEGDEHGTGSQRANSIRTAASAALGIGFFTEAPVHYVTDGRDSSSMVEHPSYFSGKLRNIHRTQFQLRSGTSDHDFQNLTNLDTSFNDSRTSFYDGSFDAILIKIHGRAATGATKTRLMAHVVCNQEIVYDDNSTMSRFHSTSSRTGRAINVLRQGTTAAGTPITPTRGTGMIIG